MAKNQASSHVRLNKWIAECGLTSRRKADEWIDSGRVKLNGKPVYELGVKVDPKKDKITVDGKPLKPKKGPKIYIAFHKPEKVITTLSDPEGRTTIKDYFPKLKSRVFPVGRLDWDTEGLLLMTDDGDFAQSVIHPSAEIPKTYLAKLDGQPSDAQLKKLLNGVTIVGGRVKAIAVERVKKGSDKYDWIKIAVSEGKNRQVRRMFEKIGFDVKKLKRVAIGALPLGRIPKGMHAYINEVGLQKIFETPKWIEGPKAKGAGASKPGRGKKKSSRRGSSQSRGKKTNKRSSSSRPTSSRGKKKTRRR